MTILVGCEESQVVCKAFRERGFEAYSCDLQECSGGHPEWHLQMDVFEAIDLISPTLGIFHPPCTHLSSSGQWAFSRGIKDPKLREDAAQFFMGLVESSCQSIAVENPIGVMSTLYRKPDQIVQPWQFGDLASKSTCLWLKNLPKLSPQVLEKPAMEYHTWIDKRTGATKRMEKWMYDIRVKPHNQRGKLSSKTFAGIASAMAEQWVDFLLNHSKQ